MIGDKPVMHKEENCPFVHTREKSCDRSQSVTVYSMPFTKHMQVMVGKSKTLRSIQEYVFNLIFLSFIFQKEGETKNEEAVI